MANFTTTNVQTVAFDMSDADNVNFVPAESTVSTNYGWDSPNNVDIDIGGTGMTYSGGLITGATTVTEVDLDIDGDQPGPNGTGDILIDNLDPSVAANITAVDSGARGFWGTFLEGSDTFDLSGFDSAVTGTSVFFGDDFSAFTSQFLFIPEQGANDTFTSGDSTMDIIGDAYTVQGFTLGLGFTFFANYIGGDDTITAISSTDRIRSVGDAWTVGQFATLTGGDDTIDNSANRNVSSIAVGDVFEQTGGTVNGGDDNLTTDGTGAPEATGDVREFSGSGTMNGGDDTITVAITDDAGGGTVEGDIGTILAGAGGTVNAGDDTLLGGDESDFISGDVRSVNASTTTINAGNDVIFGGRGNDTIYGETSSTGAIGQFSGGNDVLFGEEGNDTLRGQTGDDILDGGLGNDTLDGGDGEDWVSYGTSTAGVTASLLINTATGNGLDTFIDIENLEGSKFDDVMAGNNLINKLSGGLGNDMLYGNGGADILDGGFGNDRLQGGAGGDILNGGDGNDLADYTDVNIDVNVTLRTSGVQNTNRGPDQLISIERVETGGGDDNIKGNDGENTLSGGLGSDTINGFDGADTIFGGGDGDFLFGAGGVDTIFGQGGADLIRGNDGIDTLNGGGGADAMFGGNGNDTLNGDAADDSLFGENDADTLNGGAGDDNLRGGFGADIFDFDIGNEFDRVKDWEDGIDRIDLIDFGYANAGAALADFVQQGSNVRFINGGDTLVIENEILANITASDLIIA